MIVCFEILETERVKELQDKILANQRQTEEENNTWNFDTDELDDYIIQCLSDFVSKRKSGNTNKFDIIKESHIWEYQVNADDKELYVM